MTALPSKIVLGTVESAPRGVLFPFADRDDPQRLLVLLAAHVRRALPQDAEVEEKTSVCLSPRTSWKQRRFALESALHRATDRCAGHFVTLADIDALVPPRGTDDWRADRSAMIRRDLYELVLDSVDRGGWLVFRTCPDRAVSPDLARLDLLEEAGPEPSEPTHVGQIMPFAPEVRPIVTWLVKSGALLPRDLAGIVADVQDFDAHVVDLAYDALPPAARDAGKILSAVRPPQAVNGVLGSFTFGGGRPTSTTLPRAAADALRASGFLQPSTEPNTLRMPRLVRGLLRRFSALGTASAVREVHERLARQSPASAKGEAEVLEIHHHAVVARNVERAKATAQYYGTELRDLATQLSVEAQRGGGRTKFEEAAELFAYVVETFDATDAYAWEYLGYNLARANGDRDRVLRAYQKAHALWPGNPLYHGRLLGFRGGLGENVVPEIARGLDEYVGKFGDESDAVSFFAEAALKGLRRGKRADQLAQILTERRGLLQRFAPRALTAVSGDP